MKKLLQAYSIFWLTFYLTWIGVAFFTLDYSDTNLAFLLTIPVLIFLLFSLKGVEAEWTKKQIILLAAPTILISIFFAYALYLDYTKPQPEPEAVPYSEKLKRDIMFSCAQTDNTFEYCECNINWLENNLPQNVFFEAVDKVLENPESSAIQEIENQINKICAPATPTHTPYLSS